MAIEIKDVTGAGQVVTSLLGTLEKATGTVYRPIGMRREADAEAHRVRLLGAAQTEVDADRVRALARADSDRKAIEMASEQELLERAAKREAVRRAQQQRNLDAIVEQAVEEARRHDGAGGPAPEPIDPGWVTRFMDFAQDVSASDIRKLWSKLLAREAASPGRFSYKTLAALKDMTPKEAVTFARACSLLTPIERGTSSIIIIGATKGGVLDERKELSENSIAALDPVERMNLSRAALLHDDTIRYSIFDSVRLTVAGIPLRLRAKGRKREASLIMRELTPIGHELAALVDPVPNPAYVSALRDVLSIGFEVSAA